jgi:hypothetical protein
MGAFHAMPIKTDGVVREAITVGLRGRRQPPLNAHTMPVDPQEASAEHFRACVEVTQQPTQRLRALTGLFVAYDKLGDGQAAVPVLREAVTLAPSDVRAKVTTRLSCC